MVITNLRCARCGSPLILRERRGQVGLYCASCRIGVVMFEEDLKKYVSEERINWRGLLAALFAAHAARLALLSPQ